MLGPDAVAPIESVTANSIMGWGAFLFGLVACTTLLWDRITNRGKGLANLTGKIDTLCSKMDDFEHTQGIMDTRIDTLSADVRDLVFELKGTDGTNGMRSTVRRHTEQLADIERRNLVIDEIEKREREQYHGPERRKELRRFRDQKLEGDVRDRSEGSEE